MTATLADIRAEIEARCTEWEDKVRHAKGMLAMSEAELAGFDRAVAMMPMSIEDAVKIANSRAPRRDIAALVRDALTSEPQTAEVIARKIDVRPVQIGAALDRLSRETPPRAAGDIGGWVAA